LALDYLLSGYDLNPHVRDRNLSTPMHVVCMHGHVEAFNYLLKKEVGFSEFNSYIYVTVSL